MARCFLPAALAGSIQVLACDPRGTAFPAHGVATIPATPGLGSLSSTQGVLSSDGPQIQRLTLAMY